MARRAVSSTPLKSQSNQNFACASEVYASAELGSDLSANAIASLTGPITSLEGASPEIGSTMRASANAEYATPYVGSRSVARLKYRPALCASARLYLAR